MLSQCGILVKDIEVLESVQRFATKVCTKAWQGVDYNERLHMLNLTILNDRRRHLKLCFLYKILNGPVFLPSSPIRYRPKFPRHKVTPSYPSSTICTQLKLLSFLLLSNPSHLWNGLPVEAVSSVSVASFKRACWNL